MEKEFTLEEIQGFYPKRKVIDTGHHFLIKDYFDFGKFKLSAKIRKEQPLFKNGNPLLATQPFHISETAFSVAIGTSADCLHVKGWFGDYYETTKNSGPYLSLGDITRATVFFAVAEYDQTQNWFRQGVDPEILTAENAIKFVKHDNPATGAGHDIWLLDITTADVRTLWQQCIHQRQTIIDRSEAYLKTTSFPKSTIAANASDVPA